jgi:hypothetical protein
MPIYEVKHFYLQKESMEVEAKNEEEAISLSRKRVAGVKTEKPFLYEIHIRRVVEKEQILEGI